MTIGRTEERARLQNLLDSDKSEFCVVYGRRRVGKTYLIREAFHYQFTFQHTGLAKGSMRQQLTAWRNSLRHAGMNKCTIPGTWLEAFEMLARFLEEQPTGSNAWQGGKKVIFIDELPWMDTPKSSLISALEHFWNGWATARKEKDIVLIVCGSATSWITTKLLKNKGGLRGRLTEKLPIIPFTLGECARYADAAGLQMTERDVLELYMALGGIPYYWSFLRKGLSVAQNIDLLFFDASAPLADEYEALYHTLFKRPENYIKVIESLTGKKSGLTQKEILEKTGLSDGGTFSKILKELEQCGFIRKYASYQKEERDTIYQLIDNYTLFYHHCIQKNAYVDEQYWEHTYRQPTHNTWLGLSFERVCLQHVRQIKRKLGIEGVQTDVCSWRTAQTENHEGAQIDLMLVRGDFVVDICEMKYSKDLYEISHADEEDWERKMRVYRQVMGDSHALHMVLVTTRGIVPNKYKNSVQNIVTLEDLIKE